MKRIKRRMKRVEVPIAIPAMAPALRSCFVWLIGVIFVLVFVFVAESGGGGEWSTVTMLGEAFAGDNACETEKFPRSKSTKR